MHRHNNVYTLSMGSSSWTGTRIARGTTFPSNPKLGDKFIYNDGTSDIEYTYTRWSNGTYDWAEVIRTY